MNIVKVLSIAVVLISASTAAAVIENDSHLRKKPVSASIQSTSSSMPAALRSFLSWPANTFNIDDEHHHPLGSNYPLQQRTKFDNTNANKDNVLFSLKISTKNSNIIRNRNRRRRHLSSLNEDVEKLKEERKVAIDQHYLDISPAIESLEKQQNAAAATTDEHFETEHYFPESMAEESLKQQQEEENTTDVDEIELYFPAERPDDKTTTTKNEEEKNHENNHDNGTHDSHDSHDDAHDMVVHVTYEDICEYCIF